MESMREKMIKTGHFTGNALSFLLDQSDLEFDMFLRDEFIKMDDDHPLLIILMKDMFSTMIKEKHVESFKDILRTTNTKEHVDNLSFEAAKLMLIASNNVMIETDKDYRMFVKGQIQQFFDEPLL